MAVQLDPSELGFRRPFTHEVAQLLRLRNPGAGPIAFKVKTTAPKQYCVRPNSGRIEAGDQVEVQVLLQAMKEDLPLDARCRDKFLVQSVAITPDRESSNIADTWAGVEKSAKEEIQERKIRVVFLPADGSAAVATPTHNNVNGTQYSLDDAPPAYASPDRSFASPTPNAGTPLHHTAETSGVPASHSTSRLSESMDISDTKESTSSVASNIKSTLGAAAESVSNAVPKSGDALRTQLDGAKAACTNLKREGEEQALKQRKSDAVNQHSGEHITTVTRDASVQRQPAEGVPVQIVAALCLLSFLLAYFLF